MKKGHVITDIAKPSWIDTASNNAMVSTKELCAWLGFRSAAPLLKLMRESGFPQPRIGGGGKKTVKRWRVGDVRAWLSEPEKLAEELSVGLKVDSKRAQQGHPWSTDFPYSARGFDKFGRNH